MKVKKKGTAFDPFHPTHKHELLLADAGLKPSQELMAFERGGQRRALITLEMAYHHICQGELAGEPYMVTY